MKRPAAGFLLAAILFALLGLFVFFPVAYGMLGTLRSPDGITFAIYQELFNDGLGSTVTATLNSVYASLLTVVFGAILGTLLAVGLSMKRFRFRRLATSVAVLPVAMPPLVGVIAILFVFGEGGFVPRVMAELFQVPQELFALTGFAGIVAVHVYAFHVYTFLLVSSALEGIDGSTLEAAAILGAGPGRTFFAVVLPELLPSIVGAGSLTFMSSMASFSAPFLFGGGMPFLTTLIYSTKLNGDLQLAGAQSTLLLLVSVLFFILLTVSTRKQRKRAEGKGLSGRRLPGFSTVAERAITSVVLVLLALEMLPVLTIVVISLAREGSWTFQLLPGEYTFENYLRLFGDRTVFEPILHSLSMSGLAVVASVLIGTGAAFLLVKGALRRFRNILDPVFSGTFAIPGTVVAIFLIVTFGAPLTVTGGAVLVGTFWILPLAYFIRTYPFVLRSASSALDGIDQSTVEAASMFGSGPWSSFRLVILPMMFGGIMSGALLVLITSLGEFPSSILLYTHSNRPISIEILSQLRGYNFGSAGAYSVALLGLVLLFSFVSRVLSGAKKGKGGSFTF
ncbi:MAG: iron ABC transporter permease [Ignavibacteria bacterium]|nr:iron ABC transporter permease [Ignavibacteria bacterium]